MYEVDASRASNPYAWAVSIEGDRGRAPVREHYDADDHAVRTTTDDVALVQVRSSLASLMAGGSGLEPYIRHRRGLSRLASSPGWLYVPDLSRWVSTALTEPGVNPGDATIRALTLPELRLFANHADREGIDITAEYGEWTSTWIQIPEQRPDSTRNPSFVIHGPAAVTRNGARGWQVMGGDRVARAHLPRSGWVVARPKAQEPYDKRTGLPLQTTDSLQDALCQSSKASHSFVWMPDDEPGIYACYRECERLGRGAMDVNAAAPPDTSHLEIGLRLWRDTLEARHDVYSQIE